MFQNQEGSPDERYLSGDQRSVKLILMSFRIKWCQVRELSNGQSAVKDERKMLINW